MGVVNLVAAMFSLGGLIFVLLEALKSQLSRLRGGWTFAVSLLLGLTLGMVLAYAGLPGLGVELLPGLPPLGAGGFIGLLSGLVAPGLNGAMKKWKGLGAEPVTVKVEPPSEAEIDTLPDAAA